MMQVVQQTRDEKIAMYMKLTKRELAEMLIASNEALGGVFRPAEAVSDKWVRSTTISGSGRCTYFNAQFYYPRPPRESNNLSQKSEIEKGSL